MILLCATLKLRGMVSSLLCFAWESLELVVEFSKSKQLFLFLKKHFSLLTRSRINLQALCGLSLTEALWDWGYCFIQCYSLH